MLEKDKDYYCSPEHYQELCGLPLKEVLEKLSIDEQSGSFNVYTGKTQRFVDVRYLKNTPNKYLLEKKVINWGSDYSIYGEQTIAFILEDSYQC